MMHSALKTLKPAVGLLQQRVQSACFKPSTFCRTPRAYTLPSASMGKDMVVTTRRATERLAERNTLEFNIVGVSFGEERQEAMARLERGQPLMLLQEPSNPYDPAAVSVNTLWGDNLGYMPKEVNQEMQLGLSFGRVVSVGQNEKGLFGGKAAVFKNLLSCALDPLPSAAKGEVAAKLSSTYGPGSKAFKEALEDSKNACQVTGTNQDNLSQPLQLMPCWKYDFVKRQVLLQRWATVCAPVMECKQELLSKLPSQDEDEEGPDRSARDLACYINNWRQEDLDDHMDWVESQQAKMDEEKWSVIM